MTRADWESATPKCPKGEVANVPGAVCGGLLEWRAGMTEAARELGGVWACRAHGTQFTGVEAARRAGFVAMWFVDAA